MALVRKWYGIGKSNVVEGERARRSGARYIVPLRAVQVEVEVGSDLGRETSGGGAVVRNFLRRTYRRIRFVLFVNW